MMHYFNNLVTYMENVRSDTADLTLWVSVIVQNSMKQINKSANVYHGFLYKHYSGEHC